MREYGQIQCSFWQRASEEGWSNDAMLLGAYLLTSPHSNGIGCYRLPMGYLCDDLEWDPERVEKGFSELFERGFARRFGRVVLIPKFLRWNSISNGNVAKARQQEFDAIPNDEAKVHAARAMLEFGKHWDKGFANRLETISKGIGKQNPTQPNPQNHSANADADASLEERIWSEGLKTVARLSGKSEQSCRSLLGKWRKAHDDGAILSALAEAERQAVSDPSAWITATLKARCPEGRSRVVDAYREILVPPLPDVIDLDDERKRLIGSLSKGELDSMERWREYFGLVADTPVLTGQRPWRSGETKAVDFDFLLKHAVKIMEGKYDD